MSYPPIYVINLKRTPERRLQIQRQLDAFNLSYRFVDAVDGYDLHSKEHRKELAEQLNIDKSKLENQYRYQQTSERKYQFLACSLSHIKAYNLMIENNDSLACILEDDAQLPATFPDILAASVSCKHSWDLLSFSHAQRTVAKVITECIKKAPADRNTRFKFPVYLIRMASYLNSIPYLSLRTKALIFSKIVKHRFLEKHKNMLLIWYKCKFEIGALPIQDRSSWHKCGSDHYIAEPYIDFEKEPCSPCHATAYVLTRQRAITLKQAAVSEHRLIDNLIYSRLSKWNPNYRDNRVYILVPPCVMPVFEYQLCGGYSIIADLCRKASG